MDDRRAPMDPDEAERRFAARLEEAALMDVPVILAGDRRARSSPSQ